jgi:hypothetical protein
MYIETVPNRKSRPAVLLREGWREGPRTRKRTLANLTDWPPAQIEALRAVLKGDYQLLAPAPGFAIERTRPHGHVATVLGTLHKLRLDHLIAPRRCPERDAVVAMIVARVLEPRSKLATARHLHFAILSALWTNSRFTDCDEDQLYSAMESPRPGDSGRSASGSTRSRLRLSARKKWTNSSSPKSKLKPPSRCPFAASERRWMWRKPRYSWPRRCRPGSPARPSMFNGGKVIIF